MSDSVGTMKAPRFAAEAHQFLVDGLLGRQVNQAVGSRLQRVAGARHRSDVDHPQLLARVRSPAPAAPVMPG